MTHSADMPTDQPQQGGATVEQPLAGRVWAHVGQAFREHEYDVAIVGAGRMGTLCALYLRHLAPELRLLLVEEGGLPNEEGATILAPGVFSTLTLPASHLKRAQWSRQQLQTQFGDIQWQPRPLIELCGGPAPTTYPTAELLGEFPEVRTLIDPTELPFARLDRDAATYRPGLLALNAAQQAIRLGADLLLNTRATPLVASAGGAGGLKLERLSVTNTHQIVTHETLTLRCTSVIIAAGAAGPLLAEHALGRHIRHGRFYQQYPRLETSSNEQMPILRAGPLTLRPQHGGYTLIPAAHWRDPEGYQPVGGYLTGVPTGLRREVLEDLVALMPGLPVLATGGLQIGRSLSDVAGAWVALPGGVPGGLPCYDHLGGGVSLLLGGPQADTLGVSTAYELAQCLAQCLAQQARGE